MTETPDVPDYVHTYRDFWQRIVEHPDGTLNRDQIMRELHDYHVVMDQVGLAYDDVTGGRLSKPNTAARHVVAAVEERIEQEIQDAVRAERQRLADVFTDRAQRAGTPALRRHMETAARIAAPEPTGEDIEQAIRAGNFVVCDIPEDPAS